MQTLQIVLSQIPIPPSVALALYDTCKKIRKYYQNFFLAFGRVKLSVNRRLPWSLLQRCLRYINDIQPGDIDKLELRDIANLLVSFNRFAEAKRLCPQLDRLYDGMISNGSIKFLKYITTTDAYVTYRQKLLCKMRIPMQSAAQLEHFNVWAIWQTGDPYGHIYKFLAKTMHARSIVALRWCLAKLSQDMCPGGCFKRPVIWMEEVLSRRKRWPNYVNFIKIYAYQWGHPEAIEVAKSFSFIKN